MCKRRSTNPSPPSPRPHNPSSSCLTPSPCPEFTQHPPPPPFPREAGDESRVAHQFLVMAGAPGGGGGRVATLPGVTAVEGMRGTSGLRTGLLFW